VKLFRRMPVATSIVYLYESIPSAQPTATRVFLRLPNESAPPA